MRIYRRRKTWYVDYTYKGRRIRKSTGHSRKIAELALKDIELKIARSENLGIHDQRRILFRDYATEYFEYLKANREPSSLRREGVLLRQLVAVFGDEYLFAITPQQIEQYKKHRLEEGGVKPATVNRELGLLSPMLNKAVQWGYIRETPMKGVKRLKEPPGRLRFLEPHEIEAVLKQCSVHLRPIVLTALNTGMRLSEILTLRWPNVNLRTRTIMVERSKNNERRLIPINEPVYQELRKLSLDIHGDFVFCWESGKPFTNVWNGFRSACKRAGISDFRFHDLRHTFASHLVMAGVNLRAVQELMGHKSIKMTMRYSHLSRRHLQEAVGLLGLSLSGEMQKQMKGVAKPPLGQRGR